MLATAIDATQRRPIIGIATLVTFAVVIADLAMGGRPDPVDLRAAAGARGQVEAEALAVWFRQRMRERDR